MNTIKSLAVALLAGLLPLGAHAAGSATSGIDSEIRQELAGARQEIRVEMAKARAELDSENLSLDKGLQFGKHGTRKAGSNDTLPAAEITPKGDLLIEGKAVAINARQRQQLLGYRGQVIGLAKIGMEGGEKAAMAALEAADVSLFSLIVGGLSGSLERRVEASVKQHVLPVVLDICRSLPKVVESQRQLASSLPEFQPYATLDISDVKDCENDVYNEFAMH